LLTGEYDYSCSPADTAEVASHVRGAKVTVMERLGHFPMSENPKLFLSYLRPVLDEILDQEKNTNPGKSRRTDALT
ncbi:MAG: alpha/beta hydrolase, partial [Bradyrhizobium sp.]